MRRIMAVPMALALLLETGVGEGPAAVPAQDERTATVHGTVSDHDGAGVADATVEFASVEEASRNFVAITAPDGTYLLEISDLAPSAIEGLDAVVPTGFELLQNYPNPFNPTTVIPYTLTVSGTVELSIYNILGHKVRTLVSGYRASGWHQQEWNGHDDYGGPVAAGVYVYRLRVGDFIAAGKMALIDGPVGTGTGRPGLAARKGFRARSQEPEEMFTVTISGDQIETYVESGVVIPESNRLDFTVERLVTPDDQIDPDDGIGQPPTDPPAEPPAEPPEGDPDTAFPGQFIAGVTVESSAFTGVGPDQDVVLSLFGQGMAGVKQFEFKLDLEPAGFFDVSLSKFVPESTFFTIANGILVSEPGLICLGAASLGDAVDGSLLLGTLTLRTAVDVSVDKGATIQARSLSIGPNSDSRDVFARAQLDLCVAVNGGSDVGCR